jgi:hypothetical protein
MPGLKAENLHHSGSSYRICDNAVRRLPAWRMLPDLPADILKSAMEIGKRCGSPVTMKRYG